MKEPPTEIDGALVIEWAYSGEHPFGYVKYPDGSIAAYIYGLAIAQYKGDEKVYRFACDANWVTEQDFDYDSVEEAKSDLPAQYRKVKAVWQKR